MFMYSDLSPVFFIIAFLLIGGIFSFITAPISGIVKGITGVVTAGKRKATARIMAANAAKQRAHEIRMANLAAGQQAGKAKQTQMILLVGGGIAVLGFLFLRKRR